MLERRKGRGPTCLPCANSGQGAIAAVLGSLFLLLACANAAQAQTYPVRPVKVIVAYPPGTSGDFATRVYTPKLSEVFGQSFVVDNRVGAGGIVGAEAAARSAPDGYTLMTNTVSFAIQQSLSKDLSFDIVKDFDHISIFASTPYVIAVHPSVPAKNMKELIAYAKANPGQLTYGSGGNGSGIHLATELLKLQANIDMLHVPYKGSSQATTDLLAGRISLLFASQLLGQVRAGKVRGLAVTSLYRSELAPELPTVAESGVPGFEAGSWSGLSAPKGVPKDIIVRLNAEVTKISNTPEAHKQLSSQSAAEPRPGTADEASAYVANEVAKWRKVIITAKIQPE